MEIKLNLLSDDKKREVRRKKRYRLVVWQEIIFLSLILFYGGILLGIYYVQDFQLKNAETASIPKGQDAAFQEINSTEKKFRNVNKRIAETMRFQQEHTIWSNFFLALDKTIPEGILLEKVVTVDRKISVSGRADTRDTLLSFQERLNATECFKDAKIPLTDLFTQKDIDFQLDMEIKKECLKPQTL